VAQTPTGAQPACELAQLIEALGLTRTPDSTFLPDIFISATSPRSTRCKTDQ